LIAERHKHLLREIVGRGHELASHGYAHHRVDGQTPDAFREDVRKTKQILEDRAGVAVRGYRAATFSLGAKTPWAFGILEEEGYEYSSSIYPIKHDYHSNPDAPRFAYRPTGTERLWEYPISTVCLGGRNWPCGGGGYFRLLPYPLFRSAITRINQVEGRPANFYLHPWELDPTQPRPAGLSFKSRFRHYLNLDRTQARLSRLLRDFLWDRIDRVFLRETARTPAKAV
jgi:polysaccharide deacetylase family protein (PEP-CTERM system associated)